MTRTITRPQAATRSRLTRAATIEALEGRQLLTAYYVSPLGNDAAAGTSAATAWQSIGKVNAISFKAGDQVLFQGGQSFGGNLYFDKADVGTTAAPIVVGSYGTGKATITSGDGSGLFAYNTAGLSVKNLNFTGSGRLSNAVGGVVFYNDLTTNMKLNHLRVDGVRVTGYGKDGLSIGSNVGTSGYNDVRITNSVFFDNGNTGLFTYAATRNVHTNVYVGRVYAYGNAGRSTAPEAITGSGIQLGGVNVATVERCVAHNNGFSGNGGAGIWTYDSTKVTIQFNESYDNKTGGIHNGDGFDIDRSTSYSTVQYNYAHGNDGAGISIVHKETSTYHTNNVVRYNVMQNNGRRIGYGELNIFGKVRNAQVYNNSIYSTAVTGVTAFGIRVNGGSGLVSYNLQFRNNIVQTTGGKILVRVDSSQNAATGLKFQGNAYWSSGGTFKITHGSGTYSSLSSWRTAKGTEKSSTGAAIGFQADPKFAAPGQGQTFDNADLLSSLTAYKLQSTSPLINKGLNLFSTFAINPGTRDFWGDSLPQRGAYDVGADEVV